MKKAILLLLIIFSFLSAFGMESNLQPPTLSNDSLTSLALKQLKLKISDCREDLFETKTLPYSKTETVMVIPKVISTEKDEENNEYGFTIDAIIVVVNNQTGKIIQRSEGEHLLESDAVRISGFMIDTAPYMLSKEVRAFGVRVNYRNSSYPNPYFKTDISLYIRDGSKLRCVFGDYEIHVENGERGSSDCNLKQLFISGTIAIDTESSNGYFNLIIKEKASIVISENDENGNCHATTTEQHERKTILYYNGKTYDFEIEW